MVKPAHSNILDGHRPCRVQGFCDHPLAVFVKGGKSKAPCPAHLSCQRCDRRTKYGPWPRPHSRALGASRLCEFVLSSLPVAPIHWLPAPSSTPVSSLPWVAVARRADTNSQKQSWHRAASPAELPAEPLRVAVPASRSRPWPTGQPPGRPGNHPADRSNHPRH